MGRARCRLSTPAVDSRRSPWPGIATLLPAGARIRAVVVTDDDDVIGVAPFVVVRTGFGLSRYNLAMPRALRCRAAVRSGRGRNRWRARSGRPWREPSPCPTWCRSTRCPAVRLFPRLVRGGLAPAPADSRPETFVPCPRRCFFVDGGFEASVPEPIEGVSQELPLRPTQAAGGRFRIPVLGRRRRHRRAPPRLPPALRESPRQPGWSGAPFDDPFMAVVADAAQELSGTGRFRLATVERPGEVIAADLIVSAGDRRAHGSVGSMRLGRICHPVSSASS